MRKIRIHLIVEGRVQGVWFRESTRREAVSLGLTGWVRNKPDGSVELVAEGPEDQIDILAAWCRQGPPAAKVNRVREHRENWTGEFDSFDIVF
ncbi:MAG: acylphosphatase [Deltaproteobacteria bacterium]|nr:MAG: acylphosphatase [Desulfococcus sp. 4484_242]RLC30581.1 MAG: acylphosphatase [Deltaproteobacteria bacterium]